LARPGRATLPRPADDEAAPELPCPAPPGFQVAPGGGQRRRRRRFAATQGVGEALPVGTRAESPRLAAGLSAGAPHPGARTALSCGPTRQRRDRGDPPPRRSGQGERRGAPSRCPSPPPPP